MKQIISLYFGLFLALFAISDATYAQDHHMMHGMYGSYSAQREASGTSWQPDSTPYEGMHVMSNDWMLMMHGFVNLIFDDQGGPRGDTKLFSTSMFMGMAQKDLADSTLGFRAMFSLDPLMGKKGYPLLFQTGETANGLTPLIDRQHPHDFFMELAVTYSLLLSNQNSLFVYAGLPGEPALGPPTFMHRWSGMNIPEAPLLHHWLDSTHVTFGVITLGYCWNRLKLEVSVFNGREPDQFRWNIETHNLDSKSIRLSYNPTDNWSLQISYGHLISPEQLEPNVNTDRTTLSAIYNKPFGENNWQTILAWGQNANHPGHHLDGYLLESTVNLASTHTFFGRLEQLQKDELFISPHPLTETIFNITKLSVGYIYDFTSWHYLKPGIGGLVSVYKLPATLESSYGHHPVSYMIFGRIKFL